MSKVITVFGATGNQGGSVIKAILADPQLSKEYKIRAVTRDTSKPAAQELAKKGAELVSADLNSKESVLKILEGSDALFLVTNYWETGKTEVEVAQGKNVADAAKEAGVKQIIFSTLINVTKASNGRLKNVEHFDGKADIADYIRATGIDSSFVLAGYFMSNLKSMLQKGDDGTFTLSYPISSKSKFPLIDIPEDFGKFVVPLLKHPETWNGKDILAAENYYTVDEIIGQFNEVCGNKAKYNQVTEEQYKGFLPPNMAVEMLENHLAIEDPGYYGGASLKESVDAVEGKLTTWKEFVAKSWN